VRFMCAIAMLATIALLAPTSAEIPVSTWSSAGMPISAWLACDHIASWSHFRSALATNAAAGFPEDIALLREAEKLLVADGEELRPVESNSRHASRAMRDFFDACNFGRNLSDNGVCLYGYVAALWVKARHRPEQAEAALLLAEDQLGADLSRCLDFMDISMWTVGGLDVVANVDALRRRGLGERRERTLILPNELRLRYRLPLHSPRRSALPYAWAPDTIAASNKASPVAALTTGGRKLRVWEVGVHGPLAAEALSAWASVLRGAGRRILHRNLVCKQYPSMPDKCAQLYGSAGLRCGCKEDELEEILQGYLPHSDQGLLQPITDLLSFVAEFTAAAQPRISEVDLLLCTVAVLCLLFAQLERPFIAYISHSLDFLAPPEEAGKVGPALGVLASGKAGPQQGVLVAAAPMHGVLDLLPSDAAHVTPLSLYAAQYAQWMPSRTWEVLVRDRPTECVLLCLLSQLGHEAGSGLRFVPISESARTFAAFATYRAAVFFPDQPTQLAFFELYAIGIPLFLPRSMTTYWRPWTYQSLDQGYENVVRLPYFTLPHLRYFGALSELIAALSSLPLVELRRTSAAQRRAHSLRVADGVRVWAGVLGRAMFGQVWNENEPPTTRVSDENIMNRPSCGPKPLPPCVTSVEVVATPSEEHVCLGMLDLASHECDDEWDGIVENLREALGTVGGSIALRPLPVLRPLPPLQLPQSHCPIGAWALEAVSSLSALACGDGSRRSRICVCAIAAGGGAGIATGTDLSSPPSMGPLPAHPTFRRGARDCSLCFGSVLRATRDYAVPELFLGSRWPVWSILHRLQAAGRSRSRASLKLPANGGGSCRALRWRRLLGRLRKLEFPPLLADIAGRRRWLVAFAYANRILREDKGHRRWLASCTGVKRSCGNNITSGGKARRRPLLATTSCHEGLLCALLLLCLQFASRQCLQPRQTLDDFATSRAYLEKLLARARGLLDSGRSSSPRALSGGPWPAFALLALLDRLHAGHAARLDGGPRAWVVGGGELAVVGEQFLAMAGLVGGD